MLDIAWPELMVIGVVALVAIGPKDLPKVMHKLGQWAGKARRVAHEFQRGFEQLSYEAEIAEKMKKAPADHSPASSSPSDPHPTDHERPSVPPAP